MSKHRKGTGRGRLLLVAAFVALLNAWPQQGRAEVRVSGQVNAVVLDAREAQLGEVLAALHRSFNLQYRSSVALTKKPNGHL